MNEQRFALSTRQVVLGNEAEEEFIAKYSVFAILEAAGCLEGTRTIASLTGNRTALFLHVDSTNFGKRSGLETACAIYVRMWLSEQGRNFSS
jgi:hypothetical protein